MRSCRVEEWTQIVLLLTLAVLTGGGVAVLLLRFQSGSQFGEPYRIASPATAPPSAAPVLHLRFFEEKLDWFAAEQRCQQWGGSLAAAKTPDANELVYAQCEAQR